MFPGFLTDHIDPVHSIKGSSLDSNSPSTSSPVQRRPSVVEEGPQVGLNDRVVCFQDGHDPVFAVVRWIGHIPGERDFLAGVEFVSVFAYELAFSCSHSLSACVVYLLLLGKDAGGKIWVLEIRTLTGGFESVPSLLFLLFVMDCFASPDKKPNNQAIYVELALISSYRMTNVAQDNTV